MSSRAMLGVGVSMVLCGIGALHPIHADETLFVRGDVNADGYLSSADVLTIQRWLFAGDPAPSCIDAADINDDGKVQITDALKLAASLFGPGCGNSQPEVLGTPHAPFPDPGVDPTPDEDPYMSCDSFSVSAPESTEDMIRIGDIEASGGAVVDVPIFVQNSQAIEAVQLVLQYDPSYLRVASDACPVSYIGTYFEQFLNRQFNTENGFFTYGGPFTFMSDRPEDGFFSASIIPDILGRGMFAVPAGEETLVALIRVEVSPDAPPGTVVHLDPRDGPDGQGQGPFHLRNELTYKGSGRYPTIAPRTQGGILRIGVDGDISFFVRGDANGDDKVDISDAVTTLGYLFLGDEEPSCLDALDADDSGSLLITDPILILTDLFSGTAHIAPPYPEAGSDPTPDFLRRCDG